MLVTTLLRILIILILFTPGPVTALTAVEGLTQRLARELSLQQSTLSDEESCHLLEKIIPEYAPHRWKSRIFQKRTTEEEVREAKIKLVSALTCMHSISPSDPSHSTAVRQLVQAKTDFLCLRDLYRRDSGLCKYPESLWDLELRSDLDSLTFPKPGPALNSFPSHSYRLDRQHKIDPEDVESAQRWTATLRYCEKEVLPQSIDQLSPGALLELMVDLNSRLRGKPPGLRERMVLLGELEFAENKLPLAELAREANDMAGLEVFKQVDELMRRWEQDVDSSKADTEEQVACVTTAQWEVISRYQVLVPLPSELDGALAMFLINLRSHFSKQDTHPIQVAAYILSSMVRLHPFDDGNGRTARLIASIYLMQKGFQPFTPVSHDTYRDMINGPQVEQKWCQFLLASMQPDKEPEQAKL